MRGGIAPTTCWEKEDKIVRLSVSGNACVGLDVEHRELLKTLSGNRSAFLRR